MIFCTLISLDNSFLIFYPYALKKIMVRREKKRVGWVTGNRGISRNQM